MGYLKSVGTAVIYISLLLAVITFMPGLPPEAKFSEYSIELPKKLNRTLESTAKLHSVELLYLGQLKGAESFDSHNEQLYSGVHGGYVVRLDESKIVPIAKFGNNCDGIWQEHKCGRPLGLKFDRNGNLYVIDTYHGIYLLDPQTRKYEKIIDTSQSIDGKVPCIPNSLDIATNGDIYWTDSSTDFPLYNGLYTFLANPSGRLIHYNAATKTNKVLIDGLGFANGLKLSDDESFVIVAETLTSRIIKYYLTGENAGHSEIFAQGLPGLPDNIHSDGQGGFLVSLVIYADSEHPQIHQTLISHPYIRKLCARSLLLVELFLQLLQNIHPTHYVEQLIHFIGSFDSVWFLDAHKVVILRLDTTGEIIDVAHSVNERIHRISSAFIHKDYLWLGSPSTEYVARVPLKQAFPDLVQRINSPKLNKQKHMQHLMTDESFVKVQTDEVVTKKSDSTAARPISSMHSHNLRKESFKPTVSNTVASQNIRSPSITPLSSTATNTETTASSKKTITLTEKSPQTIKLDSVITTQAPPNSFTESPTIKSNAQFSTKRIVVKNGDPMQASSKYRHNAGKASQKFENSKEGNGIADDAMVDMEIANIHNVDKKVVNTESKA